ncbi:hypothetical protein [Candidatus Mycoplasma haematominutum]|uniref:hypothetical protein n=1 Tax=Candidatus Mycoplasma haematominutum TaxID=209446 RepID=UPI0002F4B90A|nr:hypothetical protein [Candidatus Mycoplasma haematominutum]
MIFSWWAETSELELLDQQILRSPTSPNGITAVPESEGLGLQTSTETSWDSALSDSPPPLNALHLF